MQLQKWKQIIFSTGPLKIGSLLTCLLRVDTALVHPFELGAFMHP